MTTSRLSGFGLEVVDQTEIVAAPLLSTLVRMVLFGADNQAPIGIPGALVTLSR